MTVSKYLMALAAASLATTPAFAAPTTPLTASNAARAGGVSKDGNDLAGEGFIIALLAAAAVIAGIVVVADDNDKPNSP